MKRLLLICCLCCGWAGHCQNVQEVIDGLKKELSGKPDPKRTAAIYSDLTWYYSNVSVDSALAYGKKAVAASEKLNDSTLLAQVYSDIGAVYFRKPDFNNSKNYYLKAYKIRKIRKDYAGLAKINNNLANIYMNTDQQQAAMKTYLETLRYFESVNDKKNASVAKANIGQLFTDLRDYPKAFKYLKEAADYAENENLKDRLCENYLNLAKAYQSKGDHKNAVFYNNKALANCKEIGNKKATGIIYQSLAIINTKTKNDSLAQINLQKSEDLVQQYNSALDQANIKLSVVRKLLQEKKFAESYQLLLQIKPVFTKENSPRDLLYCYKYLIPVSAYLNRPDSVAFYTNKYSALFEALLQKDAMQQTAELETKYQTAKKEKLILEKEAENKRKNTWILGISLLAFFTAAIGYLIFRQQKLKNKQQEQEFQLKSAIAQIETQNQLQEQRLSISRDLHDNIGAQLTFVISSVDNLKFGNRITDAKVTNQLTKISDFTKSTIVELRDTIWAMNTSEFTFEDLHARILNFIEKAQSAKEDINFVFQIDDALKDQKFSSIVGINLYRTMQEAVNNAVKYAEATEISVKVADQKTQFKIEIKDNGKGFDTENTEAGNGLYNMKKRIEEVGGKWKITSAPGKGTDVQIALKKNQHP